MPRITKQRALFYFIGTLVLISLLFSIISSQKPILPPEAEDNLLLPLTHLGNVQGFDELIIGTIQRPSTYYESAQISPTGFEFELTQAFANYIGVKDIIYKIAPNTTTLLDWVARGQVDFAAARLGIHENAQETFRFTVPYDTDQSVMVYHTSDKKPQLEKRTDSTLINAEPNTVHSHTFTHTDNPFISLYLDEKHNSYELLEQVSSRVSSLSLSALQDVKLARLFIPFLEYEKKSDSLYPVAWAFNKSFDKSLLHAANLFLLESIETGEIKRLKHKYYVIEEGYTFIDTLRLSERSTSRLPKYLDLFYKYGAQYKISPYLLQAVSYQESHWKPNAVSPTGIVGLMMLGTRAAKELTIIDRRDPEQSIDGGARYLIRMKNKLNDHIIEPDRTWMGLASYNLGYGHLEDARRITEIRGLNPNNWLDVRDSLQYLNKDEWVSKLKYGRFNGNAAKHYVDNIQRYYFALQWYSLRPHLLIKPSEDSP